VELGGGPSDERSSSPAVALAFDLMHFPLSDDAQEMRQLCWQLRESIRVFAAELAESEKGDLIEDQGPKRRRKE